MSTSAQIHAMQAHVSEDQQAALDQCLIDRAAELAGSKAWPVAESILRPLLDRPVPPAGATDLMARLCVRQGRLAEAEKWWQQSTTAAPADTRARAGLARLLRVQRHALFLSSPLTKAGLICVAALLVLLPWLLASHSAHLGEMETRKQIEHSLAGISDQQKALSQTLLQQNKDLSDRQVLFAQALEELPKVRNDLKLLSSLPHLQQDLKMHSEKQEAAQVQIMATQSALTKLDQEQVALIDKCFAQNSAEIADLKAATDKALKESAGQFGDAQQRLKSSLAALENQGNDQVKLIHALEQRLFPPKITLPEIPQAQVIANHSEWYVMTDALTTPETHNISGKGQVWVDGFCRQMLAFQKPLAAEILLPAPDVGASASLADLVKDAQAVVAATAKDGYGCRITIATDQDLASLPAEVKTSLQNGHNLIVRLR